jgi:hypothetical protein|tara:strand:- start:1216 stop:1428 length:213 start_codon:yes stop_codon:yes gene_type:complete
MMGDIDRNKIPKKLYNIYYDYRGAFGLDKVYQGTTDNLNAWIKENNSLIDEGSLMQPETLDDYIICEVKA